MGRSLRVTVGLLTPLVAGLAFGQTARQGTIPDEQKRTEFQSPMIVETSLVAVWDPATRTRQDGTKKATWKPGDWFATPAYHDLGRFVCDGLSIRSDYSVKKDTWESGLELSVRDLPNGRTELGLRVHVTNPGDVHDKFATLKFDVVGPDQQELATASLRLKVGANWRHKSEDEDGETKLSLPTAAVRTEPLPILRITMTTRDF